MVALAKSFLLTFSVFVNTQAGVEQLFGGSDWSRLSSLDFPGHLLDLLPFLP